MDISMETRRESYQAVKPTVKARQTLILTILGEKQMTALEIADELYKQGYTPHTERNFSAPRLTELKQAGKIKAVCKKMCRATGRNVTVWAAKEDV